MENFEPWSSQHAMIGRPKKSAAQWQQELSDVMSSLDEDGWKLARAEYLEYRKLYRKTVGLSKDDATRLALQGGHRMQATQASWKKEKIRLNKVNGLKKSQRMEADLAAFTVGRSSHLDLEADSRYNQHQNGNDVVDAPIRSEADEIICRNTGKGVDLRPQSESGEGMMVADVGEVQKVGGNIEDDQNQGRAMEAYATGDVGTAGMTATNEDKTEVDQSIEDLSTSNNEAMVKSEDGATTKKNKTPTVKAALDEEGGGDFGSGDIASVFASSQQHAVASLLELALWKA